MCRVINRGLCVFFFMQTPWLVSTISGRYCHLSRCISGFFIKTKGSIVLWTSVCVFNLILLFNMSVLMLKLCCFYFISSLYNKTWNLRWWCLQPFLLLRILLVVLVILCFYMKMKVSFSVSAANVVVILMWMTLNL